MAVVGILLKKHMKKWNGSWMANTARYYAKKGYIGIAFSYRDIDLQSDTDVGDLIEDCYDAIEYIKNNYTFVDDKNVIYMGDSAGGHQALCLTMNYSKQLNRMMVLLGMSI